FNNITESLAEQDTDLVAILNPESNYYAVSAVVGLMIIQFAFAAQPQLFNKVLSLEKERDLRKMIIVYIIASLSSLLVLFGGFYARIAVPGIDDADIALLEYVTCGLHALCAALVEVVILAWSLSTSDCLFVVMTTGCANDIFKKVLVKRGFIKVEDERVDKIALNISHVANTVVGF